MRFSSLLICLTALLAAPISHASAWSELAAKGKLSLVLGLGNDGGQDVAIWRAEGWLKHNASFLDIKVKVEQKNQRALGKGRVQLLPIRLGPTSWGIAARFEKKEQSAGVGALGAAVRLKGSRWAWPIRYYPELTLFHSKPVIRLGRLRADCQIVYDHEDDDGSLRPGVDWSLTDALSVGLEGRAYSDPEKNYLGVRLSLLGKL